MDAFLSMLASERRASPSTHSQALSALLFLYRVVLKQELPWLDRLQRPKRPQRLPVVMSVEEVGAVLAKLEGEHALLGRHAQPREPRRGAFNPPINASTC